MNNVVVISNEKEILFENARFLVRYDPGRIIIHELDTDDILGIFNFDNVIGVRLL